MVDNIIDDDKMRSLAGPFSMEGIVLWPKAVSPGKMFLIPLCIADAEPVIYHWNL